MIVSIENPSRVSLRLDGGEIPATALLLRGDCAVVRSVESLVRVSDHAMVVLDWRDGSRTTLDGYVSEVDRSDPRGISTAVDLVGLDGDWSRYLKHVGDSILSM